MQASESPFALMSLFLCPNPIFATGGSEKWLVGQMQGMPNLCERKRVNKFDAFYCLSLTPFLRPEGVKNGW